MSDPVDAEDLVLEEERVLDLVRRHVPGVHRVMSVDETGHRARTYLVDADIVLKTQRQTRIRPETSLAKEVFLLQTLHKESTVSVPMVLGYGNDEGMEYTVMTRMPGFAMRTLDIDDAHRHVALEALGVTLRRIHSLEQQSFVASGHFDGALTENDVNRTLRVSFADAIEVLGATPVGWTFALSPEQVAMRLLEALPDEHDVEVLHANPGPQHTFLHADSSTFSGLIDFGDAYASHPVFDFRPWRSPGDQEKVLSGYTSEAPVNEGFMSTWRASLVLGLFRVAGRKGTADAMPDLARWLAHT